MAYTKQTWADLPSKTTPINAERLTHIEDGIFNAAQTADTAASTAGTAAANVGIVSGRVETLTERVNGLDTAVSNKVDKVAGKGLSTNDYDDTDKGKVDSLGTASTKNSTSVVTESSDLVESGAVKDLVGWGNKNLLDSSHGVLSQYTSDPTALRWGYEPITLKAGTYTISFVKNSNFDLYWCFTDTWQNVDLDPAGTTVTLSTEREVFIRSALQSSSFQADFLSKFSNVQLERGSTATAYEPYHASVEETLQDAEVVEGKNKVGKFEQGAIIYYIGQTYDNSKTPSTTRIRVDKLINLNSKKHYLYFPNATVYDYIIQTFDTDGKMIDVTGVSNTWQAQDGFLLNYIPQIAIAIRRKDGADITVAEVSNVNISVVSAPLNNVVPQKCDNSVIGTVEGANASKAWSVGEHFIKDGQFKEVTQAIASGGAISDSNTVNKPIAELLNVVNGTITITLGEANGLRTKLTKVGHIAILSFHINKIPPQTPHDWIEVGSVNMKPIYETVACIVIDNGISVSADAMLKIETTGKVYFVTQETFSTNAKIYGTITYLTN